MTDETGLDETKRFLIEQKISFVNSVVNVCMLWWASSIVFCGSVLAAVWSNRADLRQPTSFVIGLGIVLFAFFFVIAIFGFLVAYRLGRVQDETADIAQTVYEKLKPGHRFFLTEIITFQDSMRLGAGSFALVHVIWVLFWLYLMGWTWGPLYIFCGIAGITFWILLWRVWLRRERKAAANSKTSDN